MNSGSGPSFRWGPLPPPPHTQAPSKWQVLTDFGLFLGTGSPRKKCNKGGGETSLAYKCYLFLKNNPQVFHGHLVICRVLSESSPASELPGCSYRIKAEGGGEREAGDLSALAMLTCTAAAWRLGKEIHRPQRPGKLNTWTESQMLFWIKRDLTYN